MKNIENEKMAKKAYTYEVLAKVFKWLAFGLGIAGAIACVAVGIGAGIATGLVTFLGCGLAGFACYLSSIMSEGQSLSIAQKIEALNEPMTNPSDANSLLIKEKENSKTDIDKYYTVDLDALNSQKEKSVETDKAAHTDIDLEK